MKTDDDLRDELWGLCKDNQGAWAKKHKLTRQYVNQVCNGKKRMTDRIAKILGYKKVKSWVKLR